MPLNMSLKGMAVLFALVFGVVLVACNNEQPPTTSTAVPGAEQPVLGTPDPTATATKVPTSPGLFVTATPVVEQPTDTPVPVPPTATSVPPTFTPVPDTATPVPVQPTATSEPTKTAVPNIALPTATRPAAVRATATATTNPRVTNTPLATRPTEVAKVVGIRIPIEVVGASNLGSLQFDIVYNPRMLEFQSINVGTLAKRSLMVSNLIEKGRLKVALIDASGINGDGAILEAIFLPLTQRGDTEVFADVEEATDTDLKELAIKSSPGSYSALDKESVSVKLHFLR